MSTQRNKQIRRQVSSAPTQSTRIRHVHFREIQSEEPRRSCAGQACRTWSTLQDAAVFRQDTDDSFLPSYTQTLSSASTTIIDTPESTSTQIAHSQSFYRLPEDILARGDFIAYQGGNVQDFFNTTSHTRPQRVSEICLVNDHYILVKIPESPQERVPNMESIVEEESSSTDPAAVHKQGRRICFRCFPCQRNRRILPASVTAAKPAESLASEIASKTRSLFKCPLAHCWRLNEKPEVFESHTKLVGVPWKQKLPAQVITMQPSNREMEAPLDLSTKSARNSLVIAVDAAKVDNTTIDAELFGTPLNTPTKLAPQPLNGAPLQTSLHETVTLEQHAAWLNDDTNDIEKDKTAALADQKIKQPKRRSGMFHWFFKRPKVSKPKTKIHAVVYKTYFVRWKKPPDEKCPHCGHSRNDAAPTVASCKWRRCQSAKF